MEVGQRSKYICEFRGKRKAVGIWGCKDCGKVEASGAYTLNTASAVMAYERRRARLSDTEGRQVDTPEDKTGLSTFRSIASS